MVINNFKLVLLKRLETDFRAFIESFPFNLISLLKKDLKTIIRETNWLGRFPWYEEKDLRRSSAVWNRDSVYLALGGHLFIGVLYLVYQFFAYKPYRHSSTKRNLRRILIVQPTFNLEEFENNTFNKSLGYWGLAKDKFFTNYPDITFLTIPYIHHKLPTHSMIAKKIVEINGCGKFHMISLGSFFSVLTLIICIKNFIIVSICSWLYFFGHLIRSHFKKKSHKFGFEYKFVAGKNLASSILISQLIKNSLKHGANVSSCIYICEGQSWELSLIRLIKEASNKVRIYGYIHIPYRPSDTLILNYLVRLENQNDLYLPNFLLCPGPNTIHLLSNLGFKLNLMLPVEAVRFIKKPTNKIRYDSSCKSILLICDVNLTHIYKTLEYLETIANELSIVIDVFIQLHPTQNWKELFWAEQNIRLFDSRFNPCDFTLIRLVIFGPETTAYLQVDFQNIPVVFTGTENSQNLHRREPNLQKSYFYSKEDLKRYFISGAPVLNKEITRDLLFLDKDLSQWNIIMQEIFKAN